MTTTGLANKLLDLAHLIAAGDQDYCEILYEAAERLMNLMAEADPMWNKWMILDEGLFLSAIGQDGDSEWTGKKEEAMLFDSKEDAEIFLDEHFMEIGEGTPRIRGDAKYLTHQTSFYFNGV